MFNLDFSISWDMFVGWNLRSKWRLPPSPLSSLDCSWKKVVLWEINLMQLLPIFIWELSKFHLQPTITKPVKTILQALLAAVAIHVGQLEHIVDRRRPIRRAQFGDPYAVSQHPRNVSMISTSTHDKKKLNSYLPTGNSGILSSPPIITDGVTVQVDVALYDLPASLRRSFVTSQADLSWEDNCDVMIHEVWI